MPSSTKRQPVTPAITQGLPPAAKERAASPMTILRKVRENLKDSLRSQFEDFIDQSTSEEQRFMVDVLNDRSNSCNRDDPRGLSEHEVPLFSAIQLNIDGNYCVIVPRSDMVSAVEEFITALAVKGVHAKARTEPETNEQVNERLARRFRAEMELFRRDAGRPSLLLMLNILARWNELSADKSLVAPQNRLALAVEVELNKHNAATAIAAQKTA